MSRSDVAPKPSHDRQPRLDEETLARLAGELDAIYQRVMADVGGEDARYLRRLLDLQRRAELTGRVALQLGLLPPLWFAGVGSLCLSKVLENMEIGHNVLHGQYDFMGDPALHGRLYEWDLSCPAEQWRHSHNFLHHTFTNVVGRDRDVGYGMLRMADGQPWTPLTLLQPVYAFWLMLAFELGVAMHDLELDRMLTGRKPPSEVRELVAPLLRKAGRVIVKDYVLFPMLAGPAAPLVFAGNLAANLGRNVWAFSVIFCGHFPGDVRMYEEQDLDHESRGAWYVRQIRGSCNIDGPGWLHVLTGHLSHQVEHHLFPDMPARRYRQVAEEVQAVCARYGIEYNHGSFGRQVSSAWWRILRYSLPGQREARAEATPVRRLRSAIARPRSWLRRAA